MNKRILLFDGSNYASFSESHLIEKLNNEVDWVSSEAEANDAIERNSEKYLAILTEPMTYFTRRHMREGYRNFLENVRTNLMIPIIIYTTQNENTTGKGWGLEEWKLVKGKHYDNYVSKMANDSDAQLISLLEQIANKG